MIRLRFPLIGPSIFGENSQGVDYELSDVLGDCITLGKKVYVPKSFVDLKSYVSLFLLEQFRRAFPKQM